MRGTLSISVLIRLKKQVAKCAPTKQEEQEEEKEKEEEISQDEHVHDQQHEVESKKKHLCIRVVRPFLGWIAVHNTRDGLDAFVVTRIPSNQRVTGVSFIYAIGSFPATQYFRN